jgi:hypothetical protein
MMRIDSIIFLLVVGLVALSSGCGAPPQIGNRGGEVSQPYETIWVEPRIVRTDSLFTLIRADRIDSIPVEVGASAVAPRAASVRIDIERPSCQVAVTVRDGMGYVVWRLLDEELPMGYYKFSLNLGLIEEQTLRSGEYLLRADFCDRAVVEEFSHRATRRLN